MMLDEFANIGQIPNFDKLIAPSEAGNLGFYYFAEPVTVKGHLQRRCGNHFRQLRLYPVFEWSGKNAKEISDVLGKETIDSYNQSENGAVRFPTASTIRN